MISIIIPVLNEEATIEDLIKRILTLDPERAVAKEIIVVDGGSSDRTVSLASPQATVLTGPRGRGQQCNYGARQATGDILLFLHADCVPEKDALVDIEQAVVRGALWGCQRLRFDNRRPLATLVALCANLRARWRHIVFGDQGIFIRRDLFLRLDGFPNLPLMEDYRFSLDMRRQRLKPTLVKSRITTSSRRFDTNGYLSTLLHMYHMRRMYRSGADITRIQALYENVR
ncbi:MAG TPA: glycosyl transferase family 2 [Coriobacteriia bacterium]|nr:glycosyl transferase family 2 [Coriobacteriia bacterium]